MPPFLGNWGLAGYDKLVIWSPHQKHEDVFSSSENWRLSSKRMRFILTLFITVSYKGVLYSQAFPWICSCPLCSTLGSKGYHSSAWHPYELWLSRLSQNALVWPQATTCSSHSAPCNTYMRAPKHMRTRACTHTRLPQPYFIILGDAHFFLTS